MGYRTYHTITCQTDGQEHDLTDPVIEKLSEISGYGKIQFTGEDDAKWYNCVDDMIELSVAFPLTTFRVDGIGENANDIWVKWFYDGKLIGAWWAPELIIPEGFKPPDHRVL